MGFQVKIFCFSCHKSSFSPNSCTTFELQKISPILPHILFVVIVCTIPSAWITLLRLLKWAQVFMSLSPGSSFQATQLKLISLSSVFIRLDYISFSQCHELKLLTCMSLCTSPSSDLAQLSDLNSRRHAVLPDKGIICIWQIF